MTTCRPYNKKKKKNTLDDIKTLWKKLDQTCSIGHQLYNLELFPNKGFNSQKYIKFLGNPI